MKKSRALTALSAISLAGVVAAAGGGTLGTAAGADAGPAAVHQYPHVTGHMTLGEIRKNPAFKGFSWYVVPTENPSGLGGLTVNQFDPLAGWHDPNTIIQGYNFVIDLVNGGLKIWHPLYTKAEIRATPSKARAGLWFIPGDPNKPLAILVPGGGFQEVETMQEGFPTAKVLHARGYNVAILKYRVNPNGGSGKIGAGHVNPVERHANQDMAAAMNLIKVHESAWHVSLANYSVWGASAGGVVAADWAALSGPNTATSSGFAQPAVVVNQYTPPGNIKVSAALPPFFITDCADDKTVAPAAVKAEAAQFKAAGAVYEYKRYPTGGHGFGVGVNTPAHGWYKLAIKFWNDHLTS
jgi:acetyl esterase/lipase